MGWSIGAGSKVLGVPKTGCYTEGVLYRGCLQRGECLGRIKLLIDLPTTAKNSLLLSRVILSSAVKFFQNFNNLFFGYFDPVNIYFLVIKINNFRGDLSNISAKTATLVAISSLNHTTNDSLKQHWGCA
jgi:hypothetical protein